MTVYFTSDLHLGHKAIINLCSRPFKDVDDMNAQLINNINNHVRADDTLWILGDVSNRIGRSTVESLLRQIACKDLRIVRGNHDKDWSKSNLFTEVCNYKELSFDGRRICLMHYPIASWNGMHHGAIHLHGHTHNTPDYNAKNIENVHLVFDVGVDANHYNPISWEDIRDSLLARNGC